MKHSTSLALAGRIMNTGIALAVILGIIGLIEAYGWVLNTYVPGN